MARGDKKAKQEKKPKQAGGKKSGPSAYASDRATSTATGLNIKKK